MSKFEFDDLAKMLRKHPNVKNELERKQLTGTALEKIFHASRFKNKVSREEFEKAVLIFCDRKELYDPIYFLKNNAFDEDGMCKIARPDPNSKYQEGKYFRSTDEQRIAYYQRYKVDAVDESLNYIIINGNVVR